MYAQPALPVLLFVRKDRLHVFFLFCFCFFAAYLSSDRSAARSPCGEPSPFPLWRRPPHSPRGGWAIFVF